MFSIRKEKNRQCQHGRAGSRLADHRPDNAFHPRVETLEGRALPTVTLLSFNLPSVVVVKEPSFNFSLTILIDFAPQGGGFAAAPSSQGASLSNTGSLAARSFGGVQSPVNPTLESQTVASTPSNVASPESSVLPALARESAAPAAPVSEAASLNSFATAPTVTPTRPVALKPTLPDQLFLFSGFNGPVDQPPVVNTVVLSTTNNALIPDTRLVKPQLPVQAIVNRMEFIGSAVTVADNYIHDDNPGEPSVPQPRPVNPPPSEVDDRATIDGFAGLTLTETARSDEASMPDGMDLGALWDQVGDQRPILTPELVTEVAALAACAGGFGLPRDVAAKRGAESNGMEIIAGKRRSRP